MKSAAMLLALPLTAMLLGNAPPPVGKATAETAEHNRGIAQALPLVDQQDYIDARRGLLAQLDEDILNPDGSVAWKVDEFDFLKGDAPDTANPSLWRQSQLAAIHGLFEVAPGLYQIRGYDLSVMTLIKGKTGWIVVDPLLSPAPAKAGLELANKTLGELPVVAVIFTHSHGDHFGGVLGVTSRDELQSGKVAIYAPYGFMKETVGESVLAGNAMSRRAQYQFGSELPSGPGGGIGVGLGPKLSVGTIGLLPPTRELPVEGEVLDIDGITFEFVDAGGTEAPAEFVFYLPQFRAFHGAEVTSRTQHNVLTPRGAIVRDTLEWSRKIDEFLVRFGDKSDLMLASHHWPSWGMEDVKQKLRNQRDNYRFIHDQTLRMANQGMTMDEIAEEIGEPGFAKSDFGVRGYYGTYEHNAKAVYQRYFGWWNSVPADYNALPKVEEAAKWVEALGGSDAALAKGQEAFENGEYRWGATLLQNLVFAEPDNAAAKQWLASTYEQLGFQSEGGTWRNIYLSATHELRSPRKESAINSSSANVLAAIPTLDLFDALASRFNPSKMQGEEALLTFVFPDTGEAISVDMRSSVMFPRKGESANPTVKLSINRTDINRLLAKETTLPELIGSGAATVSGNPAALQTMFGSLDQQAPAFEIVEP